MDERATLRESDGEFREGLGFHASSLGDKGELYPIQFAHMTATTPPQQAEDSASTLYILHTAPPPTTTTSLTAYPNQQKSRSQRTITLPHTCTEYV